jgi:hypothetical protein
LGLGSIDVFGLEPYVVAAALRNDISDSKKQHTITLVQLDQMTQFLGNGFYLDGLFVCHQCEK